MERESLEKEPAEAEDPVLHGSGAWGSEKALGGGYSRECSGETGG